MNTITLKNATNDEINSLSIAKLLDSMSTQISEKISRFTIDDVVMVGIHTGGYWVAQQLHQQLKMTNPLGSLSISFYRDDFTHIGLHPEVLPSELPVDVEGKHIVLVDDVLYTGRTVRAALNEIFDYGRPASVIFCALIDRAEHELPICADVCGISINLLKNQQIKLSGPESLSLKLVETKVAN
jgi:pyrimidine operon attenuation protein / uracil phosphoribosyltransferase